MDSRLKLLLNGEPEEVLMLLVRLKDPSFKVPFCRTIVQIGDIITCRVKRKDLLNLYNLPDVLSVKAPRIIPAPLYAESAAPQAQSMVGSIPSRHVQESYTGTGIYFAAVDWGFDFAHANLRNPDGTTRFKCIWNQNGPYDNNAYGYGCIYHAADINDALQNQSPYKALGYHPGKSDFSGAGMHGTHVMDIASGNPVVGEGGVATGATLVGVELGNNFVNGSDLALGDSVRLVEALDFIYKVTNDAPCVINMSLGSHGDSHTGKSLVEIAIDNFISQNKGYAIVQSVGNYYRSNCHMQQQIRQGEKYDIEWIIPNRNRTPNEIEIWYDKRDEFSIVLISPDGNIVAAVDPFRDIQISYRQVPIGYIFQRSAEPNTGLNHIDLIMDHSILKGKWIVQVHGTKVLNGAFHAYSERNDAGQAKFTAAQSSRYSTTGSVCNSRHTITAGAYDHYNELKSLVSFSSSGPTLFGQPKPDLLAPGYNILAARSAPSGSSGPVNQLTIKSGSSMAAPHVSGSIVLLFQKHLPKRLDIAKIKELLFNSLDPIPAGFSGDDKTRSGQGFLNIQALLKDKRDMNTNTIGTASSLQYSNSAGGNIISEQVHSPYLHENCSQCESILTDIINECSSEAEVLLNNLNADFFNSPDDDLFSIYRHFHSRYLFNYMPYENRFRPVLLPGKTISGSLRRGDMIILRNTLSGKTCQAVITDPELLTHNDINTRSSNVYKPGVYVQAHGNIPSAGNDLTFIKIAGKGNRALDNISVLRKNFRTSQLAEDQPVAPPVAAVVAKDWCSIRAQITYILNEAELDWFEVYDPAFPDGRYKTEGELIPGTRDFRMLEYLEEYWKAVEGTGPAIPSYRIRDPHAQAIFSAQNNAVFGPWSAAFVSWTMKLCGVEESDGFVFSRRHITYIVQALSNARKGLVNKPIHLVDVNTPVEAGDILCFNVIHNGRPTNYTLAGLARTYLDPGTNDVIDLNAVAASSHCDIVKEIITEAGRRYAEVVGGNKSIGGADGVTVRSRRFEVNANNVILNPAAIMNPQSLFAIIKLGTCVQGEPATPVAPQAGEDVYEDISGEEVPDIREYELVYRRGGIRFGGDRTINYDQVLRNTGLNELEKKIAKHFLTTEGGIDSINAYDNQIITWGFGFSGRSGNMTRALFKFLTANINARSDFNTLGIVLSSGNNAGLTISHNGNIYLGNDALTFWRTSPQYINILISLTGNYAADAFRAQWETFREIHRTVFSAFTSNSYLMNIIDPVEKNKSMTAILHAHHHLPGLNPPETFRTAASFEEVLNIYVTQSSRFSNVRDHADNWRRSINTIFGSVPAQPSTVIPSLHESIESFYADIQSEDAASSAAARAINQYNPVNSDTIVINMLEFPAVPGFINYKDWAADRKPHNTVPKNTRNPNNIKFIVLHETAGPDTGMGFVPPYTAHFVVRRNGEIRQFNDLAEIEWHAGIFNDTSVGIEFTNYGWASGHAVRSNNIPQRLRDESRYMILYWGDGYNIYQLPAIDHLEKLVEFLRRFIRRLDEGFIGLDNTWLQLVSYNQIKDIWEFTNEADIPTTEARKEYQKYFLFSQGISFMMPQTFGEFETGILSHHSISSIVRPVEAGRREVVNANAHPDGSFLSLYTWLRIVKTYAPQDAFDKAKDLLRNHVVRARTKISFESWVQDKDTGVWRRHAAAQKHNVYLLDIEGV